MFYLKYFCFFQVFQSEGMDSVSLISPPSPPLTYVCLLIYSIHGHKTYLTQMLLFNKHFWAGYIFADIAGFCLHQQYLIALCDMY